MKLRFKFNSDNVHASKNPHHTEAKVAAAVTSVAADEDITSPVCPETRKNSVFVVFLHISRLPW